MKIIRILKLYKNSILYFISAVLFFQPARYVLGDALTRVWNYGLIAVCGLYVALYGLKFRYGKLTKADVGVLALTAAHVYCLFGASFLNRSTSNIRGGFIYAAFLTGFAAFARTGMTRSPKQFMQGITAAGTLTCGIHLVTILLYQNNGGMRIGIDSTLGRAYSDNWFFLGHANASFFVLYPVIVLLFIYAYQYDRRLIRFAYAFLAFAWICHFVQWSLAGLISITAFAALLLLDRVPSVRARRIVRRAGDLRFNMIFFLVIESFLALFSGLSRYTDFLLAYFGKGQSIRARLGVWENAVKFIAMRPIFGNGWNREDIEVLRITRSHTHNILIEYLYCGGIIAVILFLFAVWYLQKQIDTRKNTFYANKAARVALYFAAPYMLASTFDYYMYRYQAMVIYIVLWSLLYSTGTPEAPAQAGLLEGADSQAGEI